MRKEFYKASEDIELKREIKDKGRPERNRTFEEQEKEGEMNIGAERSELDEGDLEREIGEAREVIEKFSDNKNETTKDDYLKEEKLTPKGFREKIENKAEKFVGPVTEKVVNLVRDKVSDYKFCRGPREGFAEDVSDAIIEILKDKFSKEELSKVKEMIDIGGGYGENLLAVMKKIEGARDNGEEINGVCLDKKTSLSNGVKEDSKIIGSYQDANETSFEDNSFDLVMATHLLQEIKGIDNKKKVLLEMKRISKGRIVIMVEFKRSGSDGLKDLSNHVVNNFNFKFDVLEKNEYEDLFRKLGFEIEARSTPDKKSPNKITYLLKVNKEKDE